jgi:hypothetical protein
MRTSLRLGGGAGFAGDRLDAPLHLAEHGALDYLILECLPRYDCSRSYASVRVRERLRRRRAHRIAAADPEALRIRVSNLGAANPLAAADAIPWDRSPPEPSVKSPPSPATTYN